MRLTRQGSVGKPAARPGLKAFLRARRSAVALEMAAVALPFFMLLLGVMEVSYDLYTDTAMTLVIAQTARGIYTGQIQVTTTGGISSSSFVQNYMCPIVGGLLDCNLISVNIQKIPSTSDFYQTAATSYSSGGNLSVSSWNACTGGPGNMVLFEAVYAGPTFLGGLSKSFSLLNGNNRVHVTYDSLGFVNFTSFTQTGAC